MFNGHNPIPVFPTAPMADLPEIWSANGFDSAAARSVHRVVDTLLSVPKKASLADAAASMYAELSQAPENADLLAEFHALHQKIKARLEDQRKQLLTTLQREQEETAGRCRAMLDTHKQLSGEYAAWQGTLNAIGERLSQARTELMEAEARKPQPESYPTRDEIDAWRRGLVAARHKLAEVQERFDATEATMNRISSKIAKLQLEFTPLRNREEELRLRLSGEPYRDPKTGLIIQPE